MIQLSRLPRCFARAEGDTSTGPKSSYRKVGTVRTRRTITGGPLRQLEDLRLGCVEDCQVLASDEARKSGGLPVSAIDGGPALQIGTQPSAGLDLETAGAASAESWAFGFLGDRRFSVGSGTPLDSLWMPLLFATAFPTLGGDRQDVRVDRHADVTIGIDLIVLRIRRRSNAARARRRKAVGHFRSLRPFDPCLTHAGAGR
jgi:hypothetical protein